ncbi:hypothetical protein MTO96_031756 [Rhipicephalus appendiculatus]
MCIVACVLGIVFFLASLISVLLLYSPVPTEIPQGHRGPFLCTVSVNFTESSLLPEDGLCDIIFYESFYVKNKPLKWNDTGLDHFFELVRSMQHTSIGASFSQTSGELSADDSSGRLYDGLDKLRTMGVKHFGMLNLFGYWTVSDMTFPETLEILRRIVEYGNDDYPDGYAVLGLLLLSDYTDQSVKYLRPSLGLRHFIAITHLSYPTGYGWYGSVLPMSMMTSTEHLRRFHDYRFLRSIAKTLDNLEILKRHFGDMFVYISFSMRARYCTVNASLEAPRNDAPVPQGGPYFYLFQLIKFEFGEFGYKYDGDLHPKKVCSDEYGNYYSYNTTVGAEFTYAPQEGRILVFDSEKGLKEKVCTALITHSSLGISLAAYDVDYDQEFEACPNLFIGRGSFRRVKALRFMSGYTPEFHDWLDPQQECVTKTYTDVGNPCCPGS